MNHPFEMYGFHIPERMMGGILRYTQEHIQPGNFLQAVISNDLRAAVEAADDENLRNLPAYIYYFYNNAPAICWGSHERMHEWLKLREV